MRGNGRMVAGVLAGSLTGLAAGLAMADNFRNPEWVEEGDAGSLPGGAQNTTGEGPLGALRGMLGIGFGQPDAEDMYWIRIDNPSQFSARTLSPGFAQFDSQLWLFRANGLGLLANDDAPDSESGESLLLPLANDGTNARVDRPGLYLLAITIFNNDPFSKGGPIFTQDLRTEISGPDGPGGSLRIIGWSDNRGEGSGQLEYRIMLTGASFANLPAPGVLGVFALAGLMKRRRRSE